jgi:hypothetical protein
LLGRAAARRPCPGTTFAVSIAVALRRAARTLLLAAALLPARATPAAPAAAPAFLARLGRVHPALFEVAEGHEDLGPADLGSQLLHDLRPQRGGGIGRQGRDALRIEEHHAGPAHALARAAGRFEVHHEEIALVIERVLAQDEVRQRLGAEGLQQREMFFAPLERLFHRDHPVPENACLAHDSRPLGRRGGPRAARGRGLPRPYDTFNGSTLLIQSPAHCRERSPSR